MSVAIALRIRALRSSVAGRSVRPRTASLLGRASHIDALAGARAAVNGLTSGGLFNPQSRAFSDFINRLAREAGAAERRIGRALQ